MLGLVSYDVKKKDLQITITFNNDDPSLGKKAKDLYDDIAVALVDNLSFELNCPLEYPVAQSYSDLSGTVIFAPPGRIAFSGGDAYVMPDIERIKKKISGLPPTSDLLQEYNALMHVSNPVQQFIGYWGLLGKIIENDRPSAINKYLNGQGVANENLPGPHGLETSITRTRHEIAHPKDRQVLLAELPSRAKKVLPELKRIVRNAITSTS